jgi:glycolate oxidase
VPVGEVRGLVREIREVERRYGIRIPTFGHLGDGNLHAHPLKETAISEAGWLELLPRLLSELYRATAAMGGTISGEHGIGSKRREYLPLVMPREQIELLERIKKALDPNGILNPGKILP